MRVSLQVSLRDSQTVLEMTNDFKSLFMDSSQRVDGDDEDVLDLFLKSEGFGLEVSLMLDDEETTVEEVGEELDL